MTEENSQQQNMLIKIQKILSRILLINFVVFLPLIILAILDIGKEPLFIITIVLGSIMLIEFISLAIVDIIKIYAKRKN